MGNGSRQEEGFSIMRSVSDKTERQTGNYHGLKHKKARPKPDFKDKGQRDAAEAAPRLEHHVLL